MNDKEFMKLINNISEYLAIPKTFTINTERMHDVESAISIAEQLFSDMKISIKEDPLELGSLPLCIKGFDIVVRGKDEIALFTALISKADNFEIYAPESETIEFNIMFNNVFIRKTK